MLAASGNGLAARAAELLPLFVQVGRESGLPYGLLMGIAEVESGFVTDAVNTQAGTGAAGLMQVMPLHFAGLGWTGPTYAANSRGTGGTGWNNPLENIRAGARILLDQLRWRGNDLRRALAGYGGYSNVAAAAAASGGYVDDVLEAARRYGFVSSSSSSPAPAPGVVPIPLPSFPIIRNPVPSIPAAVATTGAALLVLLALLAAGRRRG